MPEHHCRHCCSHKKSPRSYKIHRSPRSRRSRRSPRSYKIQRSPRWRSPRSSRSYKSDLNAPPGSRAWQLAAEIDNCPVCTHPASADRPLSARCNNELPNSKHYFHEDCLNTWVNQNPPHSNKCPSCNSAPCRNLAPPPLPLDQGPGGALPLDMLLAALPPPELIHETDLPNHGYGLPPDWEPPNPGEHW